MHPSTVFHYSRDTLGEGLFVDLENDQVFWTDIAESRVYRKNLIDDQCDLYELGGYPSAILAVNGSTLTFCNRDGVGSYDLESREQTVLSENPDTFSVDWLRANDGVALDDGSVIYGTMGFEPRDGTGGLYLYDGKSTRSLNMPLGIPNGFIRLDKSRLLIADSLAKRVNLYDFDTGTKTLRFIRCWHDFSSNCFTPDGGCTDYNGKVYFALWDGNGVAVLDYSGNLVEIIDLPVPRPTNCKLAGDKRLLITTAREGLSAIQLQEAPLSGSVLEIQIR